MRVLITGAGGFIGSHLVDLLVSEGHNVIGIDKKRISDWSVGQHCSNVSRVLDIRDMESLRYFKPSFSFDVCFHLAAESRIQPSFTDPLGCIMDNVWGTANVLQFCVESKCKRIIYAGSSTADDDVSKNVYATSKFQGEQLCRTWFQCFGLTYHIARFYNVYGPRQEEEGPLATVIGIWERQYRNGEKLTITGDGTQRRDFTHVEDIVDGLYRIWVNNPDSEILSLGTSQNHSLVELAGLFKCPTRFIPRPPGESQITRASISPLLDWHAKRSIEKYINDLTSRSKFGWDAK